ncbi:hypothetical protein Agub_g6600, partial [Astrephomene gubernaculifera]
LQIFKDGLAKFSQSLQEEPEPHHGRSTQQEDAHPVHAFHRPALRISVGGSLHAATSSPRASIGCNSARRTHEGSAVLLGPSNTAADNPLADAPRVGVGISHSTPTTSPKVTRSLRLSDLGSDHDTGTGHGFQDAPFSTAEACRRSAPFTSIHDTAAGPRRRGIGSMSLSTTPRHSPSATHHALAGTTRSADSVLSDMKRYAAVITASSTAQADPEDDMSMPGAAMENVASPPGSTRTLSEEHSTDSASFRLSMSSEGSAPEPQGQLLTSHKRHRSPEPPYTGANITFAAMAPPPT